jgi:competence protein ComEA
VIPQAVQEAESVPKLNVNTADQGAIDAVEGLRGHGFEIVRYRQERGRFTNLRQLDEVPGLSGKVDDATRDALEV